MNDIEKLERMHAVLGRIAFERKSPAGGYVARRDMVNMARRVLTECGFDWPKRREAHDE